MYYRTFQHRFQQGFSFIEVMIGVLIVSIAAYGMVVGATHARGELPVSYTHLTLPTSDLV